MSFTAADFERLHAEHDDPWGFRSRWYEARKRGLTLAMLPHAHYERAFEPGCSIGELSAALAPRCSKLLAWDCSAQALVRARARLAHLPQVVLDHRSVPREWPEERLDLVVLSEIAYFLRARDLPRLIDRVRNSLGEDGALLLCHWRHPIDRGELDGDAVHDCFERDSGLHVISRLVEADFRIEVMTRQGVSVAALEGVR